MKINGELRIKKNITMFDLGNVIDTVASFIIRKDESGVIFKPYYKDMGMKIAIVQYLLEGIEFEEDDSIYDELHTNKKLNELVERFFEIYKDKVSFIEDNVKEIVEFRKQAYIVPDISDIKESIVKSIELEHRLKEVALELTKKQNRILSQQVKANEFQEKVMDNMTPEEIAELNKKFMSEDYDLTKISELVVKEYMDKINFGDRVSDLKSNITPLPPRK